MRYDHHASLELLDSHRQSVDRGHVQVVRRLIEQQDVRVLHRELCEDDAIPEAVRELLDRRRLVRTRQTESPELRTPSLEVVVRAS